MGLAKVLTGMGNVGLTSYTDFAFQLSFGPRPWGRSGSVVTLHPRLLDVTPCSLTSTLGISGDSLALPLKRLTLTQLSSIYFIQLA